MSASGTQRRESAAPSLRRAALEAACRTVAPAWPLDRQIAFSPYWGQRDRPFALAAAHRRRLAGAPMTLPRTEYLRAWQSGEIQLGDLEQALREQSAVPSVSVAVQALGQRTDPHPGLPLLCDVLDAAAPARDGTAWSTRVTQQISEYCGAYFDRLQADWHPDNPCGFYPGWRAALLRDRRFASLRERAAQLPGNCESALHWAIERLAVRETHLTELLELVALRIGGWAAWCAWLRWEASLAGQEEAHLSSLLVTRLCWEAILHDGRHDEHSMWTSWMRHWNTVPEHTGGTSLAVDLLWQRAQEVAYQRELFASLSRAPASAGQPTPEPPRAHLVFCIDVRSERIRRAVERLDPALRTYGFAGFFGLAIRYTPLGTGLSQARLPGLLAPSLEAGESTGDAGHDRRIALRRRTALRRGASLQPFLRLPSGAFTTVEMLGLAYLPKLLARTAGRLRAAPEQTGLAAGERAALHPSLLSGTGAERTSRAELAAGILRAMGIRAPFGRLLVIIGHGAQTANNPQAATLACGACGGHGGEVNARILAALLNDADVRAALTDCGIHIPQETLAIAGLHDTTTDVIELFDLDRVPPSHLTDIEQLQHTLHHAGAEVRGERAPSLGLARFLGHDARLLTRLRRRAQDWSQVRPEWGLAANAALIIAPRERSRGVNLHGRAFLHEYHWQDDRDGALLEQICAGPLLVAHWINLQYYGSTVDPERLGSGNKVLHNVVGEHIGVLEGSGGDLRIGLARQSVHDGARWVHTPLRLSVLIDAPRERIDQVIDRQAVLSALLRNEWLYLYRLQEQAVERRLGATWHDCYIAGEPTVTTHAALPVR